MFRTALFAALIVSAIPAFAATTYEVGPGKAYQTIGAVPWEALGAGDTVLIYAKPNLDPYLEKWAIGTAGTQQAPITVRGVADSSGNLPIISGNGATTRLQLDYPGDTRGLLKIGNVNTSATFPQYIVIDSLDLMSARQPYTYTDDAGAAAAYDQNAAAIYVERGQNITIRNCRIHDSGNGLFVGIYNGDTQNILVEGNYIYDNGNVGSAFEHNNYTAAVGITFQYNHFGPLRAGCDGNNLKDRSVGTVIRYNWIESGNRQLDLVDVEDAPSLDSDPRYNSTYVYGNILIEPDGAGNSQICHYGGDGNDTSIYRKGTLYFYNNTVVSTRTGNTTLLRLSTNSESADVRNNLLYVTQPGNTLAILDDTGKATLSNNWMKTGFVKSHSNPLSTVTTASPNVLGSDPAFVDLAGQDFRILDISACRDAGTALNAAVLPTYALTNEYVKHQQSRTRAVDTVLDIGAFEFTLQQAPLAPTNLIAASTSSTQINLAWNDASSDETGFEIERSPDGIGPWTPLITTAANTINYSDLGLTASTAYFYRIRAVNANGDSAYSNIASATTKAPGSGGGGSPLPDRDGDGIPDTLDLDNDNDGFTDAMETAAGTNPFDATSFPQNAKLAMTLTKLQCSLHFLGSGKDTLSIAGVLPDLPALFDPTGLTLVVNVGGATGAFGLNAKGSGKSIYGTAHVTVKRVKNQTTKKVEFPGGTVPFTATLKKGGWLNSFSDEGVDPLLDAKNINLSVEADVTLNGVVYTETVTTLYSGKRSKTGKFKFSQKLPK